MQQQQKNESHKRLCENKNFCNLIMPSEDTKILKFNQYQKSDKAPLIIYTDLKCIIYTNLKCIIEKIDGCKNNPKNSSTTKVSSAFSMSTTSSLRSIEKKHDVY